MADSVVFITNFSAHDYGSARQHGNLRPITSGSLNLLKVDRLLTTAIEELKLSTPDDFLLISGPPVMCALCLAIWLTMHVKCNLLIFDAKEREYVVRPISQDQIATAIESLQGE